MIAPGDADLRWQLGQIYLALGGPAEAESHLRRAMELGVTPASALPVIAKSMIQQGKYREVIALAEPVGLPTEARALVKAEKALALLQSGRLQDASDSIDIAVAAGPGLARVAVAKVRILIAQDRRGAAADTLRLALERFHGDSELWALQGDLKRDAGEASAADDAYSRAIGVCLAPLYLHVQRARLRLDTGNVSGAEQDVALIERLSPGSFHALFLRGRLALQQGKGEEASAALQAAMRLDRFNFEAIFFGGLAAQASGRPNEAQDLLQRAVEDQPGFLPARYALALLRLEQGRYGEAESIIGPVVEALPEKEAPLRILAAALIAQGRSGEAVKVLDRVAAAPSARPETRFQMGVALIASGQADQGELVFDRLAEMQPSYKAIYDFILNYYLSERNLTAARRWVERFVKERPNRPEPLVWQAALELAEGNAQTARSTLQRAIALDPKAAGARYALAKMVMADGDEVGAREQWEAIVAARADHLPALLSLAGMAREAGRLEEARDWLRRAVSDFPSEPGPLTELAGVYIALDAPKDALTILRGRQEERFRTDPGFLQALGEAERLSGELQKAALTFGELIRLKPDSAVARFVYAQSLIAVDDRAGAEDALARALELDPQLDQARLAYVRLLYVEGQYAQAEKALVALRATGLPQVRLLEGLLAEKLRSPADALPLIEEAHQTAPSAETLLMLARMTAHAGDLPGAVALEQEWLASHPEGAEVRLALGQDLAALNKIDEAINQYREVLKVEPESTVALNNLAWHLRDRDPQGAVDYATRAVDLAPDSDSAADTLAAVYASLGHPADALRAVEGGLIRSPTSEVLRLRKARLLLDADRKIDAIKLLVELARSESGSQEQGEAARLLDAILSSRAKDEPQAAQRFEVGSAPPASAALDPAP